MFSTCLPSLVAFAVSSAGTTALAPLDPLPAGAVLRLGDTRFRAGGPVAQLRFSAGGSELIAWSAAGPDFERVLTWHAGSGRTLHTHTTAPRTRGATDRTETAVIPGTRHVVAIDPDGTPLVRDAVSGQLVARLVGHTDVTAVAAAPDGKRLATADRGGLVRVWDAYTFRPTDEPAGHLGPVLFIDVSPDGKRAVTTGADRTARVWDLRTGKQLRGFEGTADSRAEFTACGLGVWFHLAKDRGETARDVVTGLEMVPADPRHGSRANRNLSPCGRVRVECDGEGVRLVEVASGEVRRTIAAHPLGATAAAFTPDGKRLLTAGADGLGVLAWGVRVQDVAMPPEVRRERDAAKLWDRMSAGDAKAAYLAMARLVSDPAAAVAMAKRRLKDGTDVPLEAARAAELLESLGTPEATAVLRELAAGNADSPLTAEAAACLKRLADRR